MRRSFAPLGAPAPRRGAEGALRAPAAGATAEIEATLFIFCTIERSMHFLITVLPYLCRPGREGLDKGGGRGRGRGRGMGDPARLVLAVGGLAGAWVRHGPAPPRPASPRPAPSRRGARLSLPPALRREAARAQTPPPKTGLTVQQEHRKAEARSASPGLGGPRQRGGARGGDGGSEPRLPPPACPSPPLSSPPRCRIRPVRGLLQPFRR